MWYPVAECKAASYQGVSGIMIRDTAETFGIISEDNRFRGTFPSLPDAVLWNYLYKLYFLSCVTKWLSKWLTSLCFILLASVYCWYCSIIHLDFQRNNWVVTIEALSTPVTSSIWNLHLRISCWDDFLFISLQMHQCYCKIIHLAAPEACFLYLFAWGHVKFCYTNCRPF